MEKRIDKTISRSIKFISNNKGKFYILIFLWINFLIFQKIPYINLYLSPIYVYTFFFTYVALLFKISSKNMVYFLLLLLVLLTIRYTIDISIIDNLEDVTYASLISGVIIIMKDEFL